MFEHSAVWTIVGPDGTQTVFNDGLSGLYVTDCSGFDSAEVRTNYEDLPNDDGADGGNFLLGARPCTLTARIDSPSAADRNAALFTMKRAVRALRAGALVKSQPSGMPAMQVTARLAGRVLITGGYAKEILIPLVCLDPRIYSQTLSTLTATGLPSVSGAPFPWEFPVVFGGGSGATLSVAPANLGNIDTPCVLRCTGPASSPAFRHVGSNAWLYVDGLELAAGQWVELDTARPHTAVRDDGSNVYDRVRFPDSKWFKLAPDANTVELWATGASAATELLVSWRSAWE